MPKLNPETGLKKCTKCGEEKTSDFFTRDKNKVDGLACRCIECRSQDWGGGFRKPRQGRRLDSATGLKECITCKEKKLADAFHKRSTGYDRLCPSCKECASEISRKHNEKNKEKLTETRKKYRLQHLDREREWHKQWEKNNKDKRSRLRMNRRARINNAFVEEVVPSIVFNRDKGVCQICQILVDPEDFHIDHVIPLSKGGEHSYANTQLSHPFCNLSKGAKILTDSAQLPITKYNSDMECD